MGASTPRDCVFQKALSSRKAEAGMYLRGDGCWVSPVDVSPASKCAGCGSHEWRQHNNVRICAYCRSGQ